MSNEDEIKNIKENIYDINRDVDEPNLKDSLAMTNRLAQVVLDHEKDNKEFKTQILKMNEIQMKLIANGKFIKMFLIFVFILNVFISFAEVSRVSIEKFLLLLIPFMPFLSGLIKV